MSQQLRVMVVDDTITYRMIMKKVVEGMPGTQVVAAASNGRIALDKLAREKPQLVLLDVEMPVMDGFTTLKTITKEHPEVTVVMVSGLSRSNANIIMECLNAGALDFVTKPLEKNAEKAKEALRKDLEPILKVVALRAKSKQPSEPTTKEPATPAQGSTGGAAQRTAQPSKKGQSPAVTSLFGAGNKLPQTRTRPGSVTRPGQAVPQRQPQRPAAAPAAARPSGDKPGLLLIGSSTGGPAALTQVLGGLGKKPLPVPTLIVQHMPPVFTASLASQLTRSSGLEVLEAQEGMQLKPGGIVLAMGGRHMTLKKMGAEMMVTLNDGPKVNECRPAVDVLFISSLTCFQGNVLAVILTGMGRDGAKGVEALKRGGKTHCITQDKDSCVVYGMPRSVEEMGLSDEALPLNQIGRRIVQICS